MGQRMELQWGNASNSSLRKSTGCLPVAIAGIDIHHLKCYTSLLERPTDSFLVETEAQDGGGLTVSGPEFLGLPWLWRVAVGSGGHFPSLAQEGSPSWP